MVEVKTTPDKALMDIVFGWLNEDRHAIRDDGATFVKLINDDEPVSAIGEMAWRYLAKKWEEVGPIRKDTWNVSQILTQLFLLDLSEESATELGERLVKAYRR